MVGKTWLEFLMGFPCKLFLCLTHFVINIVVVTVYISYLIVLSSKLFLSQSMIFTFLCLQFSGPPKNKKEGGRWKWGASELCLVWESLDRSTKLGNIIPKAQQKIF